MRSGPWHSRVARGKSRPAAAAASRAILPVANPNHSAALRGILRAILASAQTVRDWEAGPTGARAAAAGEPAAASAPAVVTSAPAVVTSGDAR